MGKATRRREQSRSESGAVMWFTSPAKLDGHGQFIRYWMDAVATLLGVLIAYFLNMKGVLLTLTGMQWQEQSRVHVLRT